MDDLSWKVSWTRVRLPPSPPSIATETQIPSFINYLLATGWDRLAGGLSLLAGKCLSQFCLLLYRSLFIISMTKYIDMAMKIASLSVIPLLGWVISLEVANAERDFQLQALSHKVDSLEKVNTAVQEYAVRLGQVDQKLESMEGTVDEIRQDIKDLLRRGE